MMNRTFLSITTASVALMFSIGVNAQSMYVNPTGNVGIGTQTPTESVDVVRSEAAARFQLTAYTDTGNQAAQFIQRRTGGTSAAPLSVLSGYNLGLFSFRGHNGNNITGTKAGITVKATEDWTPTANGTRLLFQTTQNGTTALNTVLEITNDGLVKVNGTNLNVPDYVFEEDYQLMSLDELSVFIAENKHLPGVVSANDVSKDGLDLAGSQLSVLEKVEELTLYTLQQHEELKQLKAQDTAVMAAYTELRDENERLLASMAELQQKLGKMDQLEQMVELLMQKQDNQHLLTGITE